MALRIEGPGPVFYRQVRVGHRGRPFTLWKFRSMVPDAEASAGVQWAVPGDTRITRVGRLLRRTRLDEAPQFWNVLRGQMSMVGPRPERPEFVDQLASVIPLYRLRHAVRPGLTGWAQVKAPYAATEAEALTKLEYDLYYLRNQSHYLDLLVIAKTVWVVLGLKGR